MIKSKDLPYEVIVIGSTVIDMVFKSPRLPQLGQTVSSQLEIGAGGKGFNQAVASARMGVKTLFISSVGKDFSHHEIFFKGQSPDLNVFIKNTSDKPTGVASVLVDEKGDNLLSVALGANLDLALTDITIHKDIIQTAKIILFQGEIDLDVQDEIIKWVKQNSAAKIILNPAPWPEDRQLPVEVDYITPNETEAEILNSIYNPNTTFNCSTSFYLSLPIKNVLVTCGKRGIISFVENSVSELHLPIEVDAVDTTGAGDAFNGAFAAGLVKYNFDLQKAVKLAIIVSGISVTLPGTSKSIPDLTQCKRSIFWEQILEQ